MQCISRQLVRNIPRCPPLFRSLHFTPSAPLSGPFNYVGQSRQDYKNDQQIFKESQGAFSESKKDEGALPHQATHTDNIAHKMRPVFDLTNRVYIVTGGTGGIGLAMSEALAEAGGNVYCLDRNEAPGNEFYTAHERFLSNTATGTLHYKCADVNDIHGLEAIVESIAAKKERLDGLIAAAGVNQVSPAMDYDMGDARRLMDVNFIGVLATANACAKQMFRYKSPGSMCLIASMSGLIANKGMLSPVYNSSKAAVIQLARNLSMEWSKTQADGSGGIRVNALSAGHVLTSMVRKTFEEAPGVQETWEAENLMGRLGDPSEFKGAALFLLSNASSFMTGNNLVIDGGHTAW